ncbi:hypothetical protein [Phormidium nigroviride]|uniref:hypothetical protein n=1 Tax=Phormidium nigroviride TaxID=482564 RepID=UPI0002DAC64C|nr:hypothetical protein [Oscillatoria nigro-viridis]
MYLGACGDRAQFWLLKGSPQRALYFTGVSAIGFGRSTKPLLCPTEQCLRLF